MRPEARYDDLQKHNDDVLGVTPSISLPVLLYRGLACRAVPCCVVLCCALLFQSRDMKTAWGRQIFRERSGVYAERDGAKIRGKKAWHQDGCSIGNAVLPNTQQLKHARHDPLFSSFPDYLQYGNTYFYPSGIIATSRPLCSLNFLQSLLPSLATLSTLIAFASGCLFLLTFSFASYPSRALAGVHYYYSKQTLDQRTGPPFFCFYTRNL